MGTPEAKPLLSDEQFSDDGTLLQAWASHASLERIDGQEDDPPPPPSGSGEGFGAPKPGKKRAKGVFRGIKLSNKTHCSSVDPDTLLARKSNAHQPNRAAGATQATGTGERDAANVMATDRPGAHQKTIGAYKNYVSRGFGAQMRRFGVTPHALVVPRSMDAPPATRGYAKSINPRRGASSNCAAAKRWVRCLGCT